MGFYHIAAEMLETAEGDGIALAGKRLKSRLHLLRGCIC
jgi:hypothetical protein